MQQAHGMVAVWLNVRPEHEEEFNAWYELEHLGQVVSIEGFLSGRRYYDENSRLRYLALYETVDDTVEPGPGFQGLVANPTPWSTRIRTLHGDMRLRANFRRVADTGQDAEPGAIITVHSSGGLPASQAQAKRTAVPGCLRYRAFHEAGHPDRSFDIYDFATPEAAQAARTGLEKPGAQIAVRAAIGEPRLR